MDRSFIFFQVSRNGIVNQPFNSSVIGFSKMVFFAFAFVFHDQLKVKLPRLLVSFFFFFSVEIKSDEGYQIEQRITSDNHHPFCYHVVNFIQREPTEINRWVIILDIDLSVYPRYGMGPH